MINLVLFSLLNLIYKDYKLNKVTNIGREQNDKKI